LRTRRTRWIAAPGHLKVWPGQKARKSRALDRRGGSDRHDRVGDAMRRDFCRAVLGGPPQQGGV
jgi:hypothetical protein